MKRSLVIVAVLTVAIVGSGLGVGRLLYRAYPVQTALFAGLCAQLPALLVRPVGLDHDRDEPGLSRPALDEPRAGARVAASRAALE